MATSSFLVYAHRGASHDRPENTMSSFREAVRQGANGIELDVQLSLDGNVVVIHDLTLERTMGGKGPVRRLSLNQLKKLSAGAWFHPRFKNCKIPTLNEVLKYARSSNIMLNIELKNYLVPMPGLEEKVLDLIAKHHMQDQVIISSFYPKSLELLKQLNPDLMTALLYVGQAEKPWLSAYDIGARYLHPPTEEVTQQMVNEARMHGIGICPYVVNDVQKMKEIIEMGVSGIITDRPNRAIRVLRKTR